MPTILVVDDNAENRALARATLEDEGYRVAEATSGREGIAAFQRERPGCVLLDVRLPDLDGFAVCATLRALSEGAQTPIIFLTAQRDVDAFDRALAAGADDFLTQPVRPPELVVRISTALELRRTSDELREHYALVRRQRDDLMRLQLQKERLSSFVVHDLKNPVFAIDLNAQALLRDHELSPHARETVQQIRGEARAVQRMLLNLLDISKSEEGHLRPQPRAVDLAALAAEVVEALEGKAKLTGVVLRTAVEAPAADADPDLLRRVLENLLDNAIRYAPEGSEVRLSAIDVPGAVELRVSDAGSGIPLDQRESVFERFVQLDGGQHGLDRTGRGLGLAFCKLAVEAHGGAIGVASEGRGAEFWLRLPHVR